MAPVTQLTSRETLMRDSAESLAPVELSIMPYLNAAETLETCIVKAQPTLHEHGIGGEIIVANNRSANGSQLIAARLGLACALAAKGYGNAVNG